jgi:hypothetical protein
MFAYLCARVPLTSSSHKTNGAAFLFLGHSIVGRIALVATFTKSHVHHISSYTVTYLVVISSRKVIVFAIVQNGVPCPCMLKPTNHSTKPADTVRQKSSSNGRWGISSRLGRKVAMPSASDRRASIRQSDSTQLQIKTIFKMFLLEKRVVTSLSLTPAPHPASVLRIRQCMHAPPKTDN